MIIIDTHIWIWWVQDDRRLSPPHRAILHDHEASGIGLPAISCWEVAKAVEIGRLVLPLPPHVWIPKALAYPGIMLLPLSPEISIESAALPEGFHKDPADQIIVATSRVLGAPLVTADERIRSYSHVILA